MEKFFMENWFALLLGVLFLGSIIYLVITKQWAKLRGIAYALMLQAERVFSDGEGKLRFEAVFDQLYNHLMPLWFRLFVPPNELRRMLQEWYDLAKDYLDDGVINKHAHH